MASRSFKLLPTMIVFAMLSAGTLAQQDCSSVLISMSPCLDYITGNSSTPSYACCTQLANVVRSQPKCLCEAIDGSISSSLGINIDKTRILSLPNACNVPTPPVSSCSGASASSPSGSANYSLGNGEGYPNILPLQSWEPSNGNSTKFTCYLLVLMLFILSIASVY